MPYDCSISKRTPEISSTPSPGDPLSMNDLESSPLYRITHARSIALWGASSNPIGMGSVQLATLLSSGFQGRVYPIHPREEVVAGLKAYKNIADLPETVDLAVFVLPTGVVPDILEECGKAGVERAIIVSGGFGESGEEGKRLQQRLVEIADRYGIRFMGPNCLGVVNAYADLSTMFFQNRLARGYIGMASQSGSFITQIFIHLAKLGLGFSQALSVGNEANIDITDCVEYLGNCPNTKVIALYVEAIRRGKRFLEVAKEVSKKKPIVAYYVGGSQAGRQAALSHTGALAGSDALYDGLFKQCGVIRAQTIEELFDFCYVFGTQPLPKGNGVAVLTHSGGPGASAADAADRGGLTLAKFAPETVERVREHLPPTASADNPVDQTFSKNHRSYHSDLPRILLEDPAVHSLFIYLTIPKSRIVHFLRGIMKDAEDIEQRASEIITKQSEILASLPKQYGKPVIGASFYTRSEQFVEELQDRNFPILPSPERAMKALAALTDYACMRNALLRE